MFEDSQVEIYKHLDEKVINNTNIKLYKYYSQCNEDIYLNEKIFKNKKKGTYIELGALDGILYSNTKFFEDTLNWTGSDLSSTK